MSVTATPIFPQVIDCVITNFTSADTTVAKAVFTAGSNGSKIENILAYTNDTVTVNLQLGIYNGSTNYLIGTVNIPIGAGNTNSVPTVDILRSTQWGGQTYTGFNFDPNGNKYLYLPNGYKLYANCVATMSASKNTNVYVQGGDF